MAEKTSPEQNACPLVGGQAVMEGVMMRNGEVYALAVRTPDGRILAQKRPWFTIKSLDFLRIPFLRGFPILIETLVNGIKSLNKSVELAEAGTEKKDDSSTSGSSSVWQIVFSLLLALVLAIALFVVAPHMLSILMHWLQLGGDVEGLSFHAWDGFFKCCIFIGYIVLIGMVPEIRRVFRYHGAEHKTIHAFESGNEVNADTAMLQSRLHPRCGTTFLLFVICISIVLHAILVPLLLLVHTPAAPVAKHILTIGIKLLLMIPISALAYELIRSAAKMPDGLLADLLRAPGLYLQRLTTHEPSADQVEVAVVALKLALDEEEGKKVCSVPFTVLPS